MSKTIFYANLPLAEQRELVNSPARYELSILFFYKADFAPMPLMPVAQSFNQIHMFDDWAEVVFPLGWRMTTPNWPVQWSNRPRWLSANGPLLHI